MFTASLNLEAFQKNVKLAAGVCTAEGCEQPVSKTQHPSAEYCPEHAKQRAKRAPRSKKTRG